jgi:hypothetical protein
MAMAMAYAVLRRSLLSQCHPRQACWELLPHRRGYAAEFISLQRAVSDNPLLTVSIPLALGRLSLAEEEEAFDFNHLRCLVALEIYANLMPTQLHGACDQKTLLHGLFVKYLVLLTRISLIE